MATASDFADWAIPPLTLPPLPTRNGEPRVFVVQPPSVGDATKLLACAVRGEVNLGIVDGPIPAGVQEVLDTITTDEHPALGSTYQEMVDAGVHPETIGRAAYYSVFYWTRGRDYADGLALLLWGREQPDAEEAEGPAPKA
ncbi:hypothetical protein RS84_00253 [Microbacterium hydrocarbonoxydans]|uniref:DUF7426 domain-containing protein n=1 Tax=Microbacterium hydrocarbonoxydans TaxID=273678 RepID=A0A0M2HR21_9MICO|nr:hypothetical protein [Microbacterium hydrocarbonoxydans]KJL49141.1 hypothetical protein RS84_00253 [Microbacterium hydrocarbonoxydans]